MRTLLGIALVGVALVIGADTVGAGPTPAVASPNGRRLYREYCSSCHGLGGKGDGRDAAIFVARPRDLRQGFLAKYKTDELVRRVREGKPLELALDLPALRARAAEVEALATYLKRLPGIDWPLMIHGQDVYLDRCVPCHGPNGKPEPVLPPGVHRPRDLSDPGYQSSVSDTELIEAVRHGRKGMPGLTPRVSARDAKALAAYVRLFSPGLEAYSTYCAACHGDDGRGNQDLSAELQRPRVIFDREYFVRSDPERLRAEVWHMVREEKPRMPHFRPLLSDAQARAIVEYLQRTD